jgi:glycosyltransferase involved in cell wall biosynthesis
MAFATPGAPSSIGSGKLEVPPIIRVGFTSEHGMAAEQSLSPPPGIEYSFLRGEPQALSLIRSPIKGYMRRFRQEPIDLIEAVISPVVTEHPWIYSCEALHAAAAFNILGCPIPRSLRVAYIKHLLLKPNCRKVVFWSQAAVETLHSYGGLPTDDPLFAKSTVVYPAVRRMPDELIHYGNASTSFLFSGDFFRKGGVNVVDAFERARRIHPSITLTVCCDLRINFITPNEALRAEYLAKLAGTEGIIMRGRVSRDELIQQILPKTDVYLLPTYAETFGMSVLEAMAFGIPVIATDHFAIPEILEDGVSGILIDTSPFDLERMFRGYVVNEIPPDFRQHVTDSLFTAMCRLIESADLRRRLGAAALEVARTKFSFECRNRRMREIYDGAMDGSTSR